MTFPVFVLSSSAIAGGNDVRSVRIEANWVPFLQRRDTIGELEAPDLQ